VVCGLAIIVALADGGVERGAPGEVAHSEQRDRGLHTHARPQQELQNLGRVAK